MAPAANELRPLPLRLAGVIGMASAGIYMAGVTGSEDSTQVPAAVFWFGVILITGVVAWLADRSQKHGRNMAKGAAAAFFVLGILSNTVFAMIYLAATTLSVLGFAGTAREESVVED